MWLPETTAPPEAGMFSSPSNLRRCVAARMDPKTARATAHGTSSLPSTTKRPW